MSVTRAPFATFEPLAGAVVHFPWPMTYDQASIDAGRARAKRMYQDARTKAERLRALIWINHWRTLNAHAFGLRGLGLIA